MSSPGIEARPSRKGWLFGRWTDLLVGCGLGYILSVPILFYVGEATGASHWPAFLVTMMGLFLNVPHYGATIVRVYDAREDRRKYVVFSVYATLALALAFVASSWNVWLASLLITTYVTWSPWHFSGQNYGLTLMFLRRRGIDVDPTTKRLLYGSFVLSAALAIIAVHAGHGDIVFAPSTLHAANTPTTFYLGVPPALTNAVLAGVIPAYLACLAAAAWRLRGMPLRDFGPAFLLVLSQALWFTIPAITLDWSEARRNTLFFAAIWVSTAHSVQYLWVTAYYEKSSGREASTNRFLLKSFAAGSAITTLPGILLAPHLLGALPVDAGLAATVFAIVNIHHFILDGAIWKLRDGRVARVLLRTPEPPGLAEPIPSPRKPWVRRLVWTVAGLTVAVPAIEYAALRSIERTDQADRIEIAVRFLRWVGREKVKTQFNIGRLLAARGHRADAIEHFRRSIELFPTGRAWAALGVEYRAQGRWDLALNAFDSALELNPAFFPAHYRRAEALLQTASPEVPADVRDQAIESLERALELAPGFADAARMLARLQAESGRTDQAILTLERALEEVDAAKKRSIHRQLRDLRGASGGLPRDPKPPQAGSGSGS